MQKRVFLQALGAAGLLGSTGFLAACGKKEAAEAEAAKPLVVKCGVTAGPHSDIVHEAAKVAESQGFKIEVTEFTDYVSPDRSLADKSLDVVVYQHKPYMDAFNQKNGTNLVKVADAVVQPMGLYSNKVHKLEDLPESAMVTIPNDPSNGGRALLLLQTAKLLKLKDGVKLPTVADIVENPKKLVVKELEAAQMPRSLDDATLAAVPMNYSISAGLSIEKQGVFFESKKDPFALMIIVARPDNAQSEGIQRFIKAYQSDPVKKFIAAKFKGAVNPAW